MNNQFSAEFKSEVVLEAIKEQSSLHELSEKYGVPSDLIVQWKNHVIENSYKVFLKNKKERQKEIRQKKLVEKLTKEIETLTNEQNFLKRVLEKY